MLIDDVWRTIEATLGNLTPAKARELAKNIAEPGAAKEQVAKTAADLMEWSQHNRERIRGIVSREMSDQVSNLGLASRKEVDALKKRVRDLERAAGMTASGRGGRTPAKKTAAKKSAATKSSAKRSSAKRSSATKTTARTRPTGGAAPSSDGSG